MNIDVKCFYGNDASSQGDVRTGLYTARAFKLLAAFHYNFIKNAEKNRVLPLWMSFNCYFFRDVYGEVKCKTGHLQVQFFMKEAAGLLSEFIDTLKKSKKIEDGDKEFKLTYFFPAFNEHTIDTEYIVNDGIDLLDVTRSANAWIIEESVKLSLNDLDVLKQWFDGISIKDNDSPLLRELVGVPADPMTVMQRQNYFNCTRDLLKQHHIKMNSVINDYNLEMARQEKIKKDRLSSLVKELKEEKKKLLDGLTD